MIGNSGYYVVKVGAEANSSGNYVCVDYIAGACYGYRGSAVGGSDGEYYWVGGGECSVVGSVVSVWYDGLGVDGCVWSRMSFY